MRLLWLTDREASDAGANTVLFVLSNMCCAAGMSIFAVAVALWQSAEQRCREMEAADAASVARLVRGVCCCHVCPEHIIAVLLLVICMLLWW